MATKKIKKIIWYSLKKILATKPDVAMVIGQRGNGKTFDATTLVLDTYKKTRRRFAYVRRWKEDLLNGGADSLFAKHTDYIEKLFGKDYSVVYYARKYYLCNEKGEKLDIIGYAVALSEASHTKSKAQFIDIKYIIFDEFIQMQGEPVLRNEMSKFENTMSSLSRGSSGILDDVVIICLANTVSKFSIYFVHWGINIDKVKQGEIKTKEIPIDDDKGILRVSLEWCEYNPDIGKQASKYSQSKMINRGQWEIPETDDIPHVVGEIVKDRLLCSIYDPDAEITIGCFVRNTKWVEIVKNENTLLYENKTHVRQFLILKQITGKSSYFHLTNQKSLTYTQFNDISMFLRAIYEETDINIEDELYMGRIFADNMFTADYFNHVWTYYGQMTPRKLL